MDADHRGTLKRVWAAEAALHENLLPWQEVRDLYEEFLARLDEVMSGNSLAELRYRKMRLQRVAWWYDDAGYLTEKPWPRFEAYLEVLAQHEAGKTIKRRLKTGGLFVESRAQDEDLHILVGARDGSAAKAHMILDGRTGEIRVEDNQTEPTELVAHVMAIITLKDGRRIRTTREAVELLGVGEPDTSRKA